MRRLFLLRHAKSAWDDPALDDFDRPLNERGRNAAAAMAAFFNREGYRPDVVLCSPARRTRETLAAFSGLPQPAFPPALYHASAETIIRLVEDGLASGSVLVVGHNPGMHNAVLRLLPNDAPERPRLRAKFPTGALAVFDASAGLKPGGTPLHLFQSPKTLL